MIRIGTLVALLSLAAISLGGCITEPRGMLVVNHTNDRIEVLSHADSGEEYD